MNRLKKLIDLNIKRQNFDYLALSVIDFKAQRFETLATCRGTVKDRQKWQEEYRASYFDLASVSKPLNLALAYMVAPKLFDQPMRLLLEHRSGLPAWGRLSHRGWREQIMAYPISESATEYSDFGALRLMLEIERVSGKSLKHLVSPHWDQKLSFWQDLADDVVCVPTGMRRGEQICGVVHDDNALVINEYTSHAGLFATIEGISRTLLRMDQSFSFLNLMKENRDSVPHDQRFLLGWDRVLNPQNTLAGAGCSASTFGHLGFTGTSVWIDPEKQLGHVILTNATIEAWYQREGLSELRRLIGEWVWTQYRKN